MSIFYDSITYLFSQLPDTVTTTQIMLGLASGTAVIAGLVLFKRIFLLQLSNFSEHTKNDWDDLFVEILQSFNWFFIGYVGIWTVLNIVPIPESWQRPISITTTVIVFWFAALSLQKIISYIVQFALKKNSETKEVDPTIQQFMKFSVRVAVWVVVAVIALQNVGVEVTGLIATLGVVGIGVGFALQQVLSDVFAYISIYFDKPFKVGDFVQAGNATGTVKRVGVKSTRITTLSGEELVVPNQELVNTQLHNYRKMTERRVEFHFGVTYETPLKKLQKIEQIVTKILAEIEDVELDRVHFSDLGDSALIFEVIYKVKTKDYVVYMNAKQTFFFELIKAFEKESIEFAYPTQTIYQKK